MTVPPTIAARSAVEWVKVSNCVFIGVRCSFQKSRVIFVEPMLYDVPLGKRMGSRSVGLAGFMTFARKEDGIARICIGKCLSDGVGAVFDDRDLVPFGARNAADDLCEDIMHAFGAAVVCGQDDMVGMLCSDLAHQRTLGLLTVAAASENDRQSANGMGLAKSRQGAEKGIGGVCVIKIYGKRCGAQTFHASGDRLHGTDRRCDVGGRDPCGHGTCGSGKSVCRDEIKAGIGQRLRQDRQRKIRFSVRRRKRITAAGKCRIAVQPHSVWIVDIDDGAVAGEKQLPFGEEIVLHGGVVVEMILT